MVGLPVDKLNLYRSVSILSSSLIYSQTDCPAEFKSLLPAKRARVRNFITYLGSTYLAFRAACRRRGDGRHDYIIAIA